MRAPLEIWPLRPALVHVMVDATLHYGGPEAVHHLRALWREHLLPRGVPTESVDSLTVPSDSLTVFLDRGGRAFAGCDVVAAVAHSRLRHCCYADPHNFGFSDLLRLAFPGATAGELTRLLAAAPPRPTREEVDAAREAAKRQVAALDNRLLARADADGSGELDRGEFCALLAQLGVACSEEQNALFEAADEDCSSAVSITEFRSWWLAHEAS